MISGRRSAFASMPESQGRHSPPSTRDVTFGSASPLALTAAGQLVARLLPSWADANDGRRRSVMAGRSWTELFFLDEPVAFRLATALAFFAGVKQRNCFARLGRLPKARGLRLPPPSTRSCIASASSTGGSACI